MVINCINLLHRRDRRISAFEQAQSQKLDILFWNGVEDRPRAKGIMKAHLNIIQHAKENNLPEVVIMEDDCMFTAPDSFEYYMKNKPEEFDVYWGGIYSGQLQGDKIINGISGMTLYTVSQKYYDFMLGLMPRENDSHGYMYHIDRRMGAFAFEKDYRVCLPFVVYQSHGFSDNHNRITTLDPYHEKWDYYKNRPPLSS